MSGHRIRPAMRRKGGRNGRRCMFGPPGVAYVYLIYGMYHCLNVVTEREEFPSAVLIRAIEIDGELIDGPGRLCRALQIDRGLNRVDLTTGESLWFEDRGGVVGKEMSARHPRIGVDYAGKWAEKLWRFRLRVGHSPHAGRDPQKNREAPDRSAPPCYIPLNGSTIRSSDHR